jgi:hypothetical protein
LPLIRGNGANNVVVSSISITHGVCPRMKGELGRKDKTALGKDICDRSDRERINLERSLMVDPFVRASRQNRMSDLIVRCFGELGCPPVTNS